ncbi:MAG: MFS transporter [Chloroflexota bacterium]
MAKKPGLYYGYIIVVCAFIILGVFYGTQNTFGIFFQPLSDEFGWTRAATSGAFTLFMVLHGLLFMVTGRLSDRFGPRLVLTVCALFMGLGYLLMSHIGNIWQLYLFYGVLVAAGMAGGFVPLTSTVARWFVKRRGMMNGIAVAGIGAGTMVLPPAAGWLISGHGWRDSYIVIGLVVLVGIIPLAQFVRRAPADRTQLLPDADKGVPAELSLSGYSLGQAMHTRQLWQFCLAYFGYGFFLQAIMVHIVPHMTGLGISEQASANVFIAIGALSLTGRIIIGSASDRLGLRPSVIGSFALATAALAWLFLCSQPWMFYLFAVVFGLGYGGIVALQSPLAAELFGLKAHGSILGISATIVAIGHGIGPLAADWIFDTTGSYHVAFVITLALSSGSLFLAGMLKPSPVYAIEP